MEEQQHRFRRLQEDLIMAITRTPTGDVTHELVDEYHDTYREIWKSTAERWLESRNSAERG